LELYQEDRELVRERPPMWQGYVLSGWWRRVGAYLVDGFAVTAIAVLPVLVLELQLDGVFTELLAPWGVVSVGAVAALAYYPFLMRATNGCRLPAPPGGRWW